MDDNSMPGRREFLKGVGGATGMAALSSVAAGQQQSDYSTTKGVAVEHIGRYSTGYYDEGGAEIGAHAPNAQRFFVTNGAEKKIDVLDISDPTEPGRVGQIPDVGTSPKDGATNVSVMEQNGTEIVVAAVENENTQANGWVMFFDADDLSMLAEVQVGPLPDCVTVTDDGNYALTANEGEPADDYSTDPAGSISVIDLSNGVSSAATSTADFTKFDGQEDTLRERGVRIYGNNDTSSASQDLEPEYIATANGTAYVTLQENNALAIVDIANAEVTEIKPLGYKDFSLPKNALDAIEDGNIDITTQPLYGMYQPDTIQTYTGSDGDTYVIMANEGDAREYTPTFEVGVLKNVNGTWGLDTTEDDGDNIDVEVDETQFDSGVLSALEGLEATSEYGDVDDDGTIEQLYLFGARSISIHDADGNRVYESGNDIELRAAAEQPNYFNTDDDENAFDKESAASGPEQEGVATGTVGTNTYAFIGLEEISSIMTFDVTDPARSEIVDYTSSRNFDVDPEDEIEDGNKPADAAGDLSCEGVLFIPASESPVADPLLAVCYEVSGTTSLYRVQETTDITVEDDTFSDSEILDFIKFWRNDTSL